MLRSLLVLAIVGCVLSGCSATRLVDRADSAVWGPRAVHEYGGNAVSVILLSGREIEGEILKIDTVQLLVRETASPLTQAIPLDSVVRIHGGSNAGWVVAGFAGGALTGGVIGMAIGGTSAEPQKNDPLGLGSAVTTAASSAAASLVGAGLGGIVGGMIVGLATKTRHYTLR